MAGSDEKKVLLRVEIDNSDLVKRAAEVRIELDKLKKEAKSLQDQLKNPDLGTEEYQKLQEAVVKNTAAQNAYKKELSSVSKEIDTNIKLLNSAEGSNEQLRASLSLLTSEYNKLSEEERNNTTVGQTLQKTIKEISDELKQNESAIGDNRRNVGNYKESLQEIVDQLEKENKTIQSNIGFIEQQRIRVKGMGNITSETKNQIGEFNNQIEQQSQKFVQNQKAIESVKTQIGFLSTKEKEAGGATTTLGVTIGSLKDKAAQLKKELENPDLGLDKFKELNEELIAVELQIDQASGKLNKFGDKEARKLPVKKAMDDAFESAAALTESIGLLTVAFGKNETVAELEEKALKAIAIANTISNIAKARGAILDTLNLIKTKALTIAQNLYTAAIGRSTGAARIFKVALASTGIGVIVVLLGELIFNFDQVSLYIKRAVQWVRDFSDKVSKGNKVVKALVEILLLVASPLVTIIRLISDFTGTITDFQNAINGAYDWLIKITDGIPILGDAIKLAKAQFNFLANAVKSLAGENKEFKPSVEGLTKVYENLNKELDKNNKKIQNQIAILKAQGNSEREVANLTRKMLQDTTSEREKAYKKAVEVSNKLIKQNGKLNDEQQDLFDKIQADFQQAQTDQAVFDAEQAKEARDRAKERLQIERDLQSQLNELRNSLIKNEFDRREAELNEKFRQDKQSIEAELKNANNSQKIRDQLNEKLVLLQQKLNNDLHDVDQDRQKKVEDEQKEFAKIQEEQIKNSFAFKSSELAKSYQLELSYLDASFVSTAKTEQEKTNELIDQNVKKLQLTKKYYEDQLALTKTFAEQDGILTDDELKKINELSTTISNISDQISMQEKNKKNILGLTQSEMDAMLFSAQKILDVVGLIADAINASFDSAKRSIDDAIDAEIEGVNKTTLAQTVKDAKIKALEKKRAEQQYRIQVQQFEFQQAVSVVQAIINGAVAFVTALTSGVPPFNFINAGLVAASTAVQIGIIASQKPPSKPKFFGGGFTEQSGNPYLVSRYSNDERDLHHNEYVTPWKVLKNPKSQPHISALESLRLGTPGSLSLKGFADGGFNSRSLGAGTQGQAEMIKTISSEVAKSLSLTTIEVSVTEFERVQAQLNKAKAKAVA